MVHQLIFGKLYKSFYGVEKETGRIDMDKVELIALKEQLNLIYVVLQLIPEIGIMLVFEKLPIKLVLFC